MILFDRRHDVLKQIRFPLQLSLLRMIGVPRQIGKRRKQAHDMVLVVQILFLNFGPGITPASAVTVSTGRTSMTGS